MKKYTKLIVSLLFLAVLLSGCTISVRDLPQDTENQSAGRSQNRGIRCAGI